MKLSKLEVHRLIYCVQSKLEELEDIREFETLDDGDDFKEKVKELKKLENKLDKQYDSMKGPLV